MRIMLVLSMASLLLGGAAALAQSTAAERQRLEAIERQGRAAEAQRAVLERKAAEAAAQADEAAAAMVRLAARIQANERAAMALEQRLARLDAERRQQRARLAARQGEVVRLLAALETLSRRPAALVLVQPESAIETGRVRAMLDMVLPVLRNRTAALRAEMARANEIRAGLAAAQQRHRDIEAALARDNLRLAGLEQERRRAGARYGALAAAEADRAAALALSARDLRDLLAKLDQQSNLRARLAALPGPRLRPAAIQAAAVTPPPPPERPRLRIAYRMPAEGALVTGFGAAEETGLLSKGITLRPRRQAQVVAPAAGRVAFAGPFRTYGRIVIIEHGDGLLTLLAGLGAVSARLGETVKAGQPVGQMAAADPRLYVELRVGGEPVDPLPFIAGNGVVPLPQHISSHG